MKYCSHCGAEIKDEAVVCIRCGCHTGVGGKIQVNSKDDTMQTIIKVFLIIGCVSIGWAIIPLAWCIPITVNIFKKLKSGEPISTGLKICTLLFVNLVAGICLLCSDD